MSDGNKRAFTLIELLIVLSLIAILAALLFPALASARHKASETQCLSNMRQISLAVQLYLEDNEETFPLAIEFIDGVASNENYWATKNYQKALEPYIRTGRGILNRQSVWFDPADPDANDPVMWGSFLTNGFLSAMPRHLSEVATPSETIYSVTRRENWAQVVGVAIDISKSHNDENDPFWQSKYFNMSLMLWSHGDGVRDNPEDPFNWRNGKAELPCYLRGFPPPLGEQNNYETGKCKDYWDNSIYTTRYGGRILVVYADGHAGARMLEQTYRSPDDNQYDLK